MSEFWDKYGSAIIVLVFAYFVYAYLANYNNEREQKFEAMSECMNKTEYAEGNFDQCADEIGYK